MTVPGKLVIINPNKPTQPALTVKKVEQRRLSSNKQSLSQLKTTNDAVFPEIKVIGQITTTSQTDTSSNLTTEQYFTNINNQFVNSAKNWWSSYNKGTGWDILTAEEYGQKVIDDITKITNIQLRDIYAINQNNDTTWWDKTVAVTQSLAQTLYTNQKSKIDDLANAIISEIGVTDLVNIVFDTSFTATISKPQILKKENNSNDYRLNLVEVSSRERPGIGLSTGEIWPYAYWFDGSTDVNNKQPFLKKENLEKKEEDFKVKGFDNTEELKLSNDKNYSVWGDFVSTPPDFLSDEYNCAFVLGDKLLSDTSTRPFNNASFTVRLEGISIPGTNSNTATLSTGISNCEIITNKLNRNTKATISLRLDQSLSMIDLTYGTSGKMSGMQFLKGVNAARPALQLYVKKEWVTDKIFGDSSDKVENFIGETTGTGRTYAEHMTSSQDRELTTVYHFKNVVLLGLDGALEYSVHGGRQSITIPFIYSDVATSTLSLVSHNEDESTTVTDNGVDVNKSIVFFENPVAPEISAISPRSEADIQAEREKWASVYARNLESTVTEDKAMSETTPNLSFNFEVVTKSQDFTAAKTMSDIFNTPQTEEEIKEKYDFNNPEIMKWAEPYLPPKPGKTTVVRDRVAEDINVVCKQWEILPNGDILLSRDGIKIRTVTWEEYCKYDSFTGGMMENRVMRAREQYAKEQAEKAKLAAAAASANIPEPQILMLTGNKATYDSACSYQRQKNQFKGMTQKELRQ